MGRLQRVKALLDELESHTSGTEDYPEPGLDGLYKLRQDIEKVCASDDAAPPEERVLSASLTNALVEVTKALRELQYAMERARMAQSAKEKPTK